MSAESTEVVYFEDDRWVGNEYWNVQMMYAEYPFFTVCGIKRVDGSRERTPAAEYVLQVGDVILFIFEAIDL